MPRDPYEVTGREPAAPATPEKPFLLKNPYEVTGTEPLPRVDAGPRAANPTLTEDVTSMLPLAGAIGFSMATGPAAPATLSILMGGLGAGAGKAFQQISNRIMGAEFPSTGGEATKEIAGAMGNEILWGGAFGVGAKGLRYAAAPGRKEFMSPAVQKFMKIARQEKMLDNLTPAEILDNTAAHAMEWVGSLTTHSRKLVANRSAKTIGAGVEAAQRVLDKHFGQEAGDLATGAAIQKTVVENVGDAFRAKKSELYKLVDDAAGNAEVVDTKPVAKLVEEKLLAEAKMMSRYPGTFKRSPELVEMMTDFLTPESLTKILNSNPEAAKALSGMGLSMQEVVAMMPVKAARTETFTAADQLRSKWLERGRESGKKDVIEFAAKAERVIEEQIEAAGKGLGPDVYPKLKTAREFYREGKQLIGGAVYNRIIAVGKSQDLVNAIKPGDVQGVRDLRKAVVEFGNDPDAWDGFRRQWVANQIGDDITKLPERMAAWSKRSEFTQEMFGDLRGKIVLKHLDNVATIIGHMGEKSQQLGFQRLGEARSIISVAGSIAMGNLAGIPAAAKTLFLPSLVTKTMHSPFAMKYFTEGLSQVPKDTGKAAANITRAFKIALKGIKAIEDTND